MHCLLWLRGENDEEPPVLWSKPEDDVPCRNDISNAIATFSSGLILGSASQVHCENHQKFISDCESCSTLKADIVKYQSHRHKFTCYKKGKRILIGKNGGHGRHDKKDDVALELKSCRFNFPRNPIDKNEFIFGFSKKDDEAVMKKAMKDYEKIRKYLLRLTHCDDFENSERWKAFIKMSFYEFLYEVGMFETDDWSDSEAQQKARERYLTALRLIMKYQILTISNFKFL